MWRGTDDAVKRGPGEREWGVGRREVGESLGFMGGGKGRDRGSRRMEGWAEGRLEGRLRRKTCATVTLLV